MRHAQNRHKVAPVGDEQRAERGEHERPEHDGERAVVPQAEGRENRIERVEKCRTEAEEQPLRRQRQSARENARHERTAEQRQREGKELFARDLLFENKRAHQNHHRGRGVEQNRADRERAKLLRVEVAEREEHDADDARRNKDRQVLCLHFEDAAVGAEEEEREHRKAAQVADDDKVFRRDAGIEQRAVE